MAEIQALARGLQVLMLLAEAKGSLGVNELAERMGVNKGTASRMVQTLKTYGFVELAADGRRYALGPVLVRLSRAVLGRNPLRETAKPYLRKLVNETGECAHLAIYAQGKALYIDQVESAASLRVNAEIGHMAPLHCTALGKVLLAFGECPTPTALERRTSATIITQEGLREELEKVRAQGYATDNEEYDVGVRCAAVPVFGLGDKLVGAMGISGPAVRMGLEEMETIAGQVMAVGMELSERLKFVN